MNDGFHQRAPKPVSQIHPMLIPSGYRIGTRPIERLTNATLFNIDADHHGMPVPAPGRVGKSTAGHYLTEHASIWLKGRGIAGLISMPKGNVRSDGKFFDLIGDGLKLGQPPQSGSKRPMKRIANYILTRCGVENVRYYVLFIDNSQRLTHSDFEYLVDLDDAIEAERVRLFLLLITQNDASGIDVNLPWSVPAMPSHIAGRFFMCEHRFTCLTGLSDIQHAMGRYDYAAFWPNEETSFTRYWAPKAVADGWTYESQAALVIQVIQKFRERHNLPESDEFPMKTFTGMTNHLLCDIAGRDTTFHGFTEKHIERALDVCGYLTLERVRAGLLPESQR